MCKNMQKSSVTLKYVCNKVILLKVHLASCRIYVADLALLCLLITF